MSINGLTTTNGLIAGNGLTSTNGLIAVNGLMSINGLSTFNGLLAVNGLTVDCYNKTPGTSCTGAPNGLLSKATGLMKDDAGVDTARYLVRCALPSTKTIAIQKYDGTLVSLGGEIGVAPEWATGTCNQACQEKVSACLMALVNGSGAHIAIEMTAAWAGNPLGENHTWEAGEAAFYGNLFKSPPEAYLAAHYAYTSSIDHIESGLAESSLDMMARSCSAFPGLTMEQFLANQAFCPLKLVGTIASWGIGWSAIETAKYTHQKCSLAGGSWKGTAKSCAGPGTNTETWNYPITTWRPNYEVWYTDQGNASYLR